MVEIRKLTPSVGVIKLPPKQITNPNYQQTANRKRHERRREDYPPPTPQDTPCVIWQGILDRDGYGRYVGSRPANHGQSVKRSVMGIHRWVVEQTLGRRLRTHEVIMHLCDNRLCFRESHLRVGTIQENNKDRDSKGRLVHVPQHMHGETNGRAKLTRTQVKRIRKLYKAGVKAQTLANEYGVNRSTVMRAVRGLTWASDATPEDIFTKLARRKAGDEMAEEDRG